MHKISIAPKFWIDDKFFTIVFFFDITTAPFARLVDTITGNISGVSPIATETAKINDVIKFPLNTELIIKTAMAIITTNLISIKPISFTPLSKLVSIFLWEILFARLPKYVWLPIDTTTPTPLPLTTFVPIKHKLFISSGEVFSTSFNKQILELYFSTGVDSPVKDDCEINKSLASKILKSAGIIEPAVKTTISPGTTSFNGISTFLLFLITEVVVFIIAFNFSVALSDFVSCIKSKIPLKNTITDITITDVKSFSPFVAK